MLRSFKAAGLLLFYVLWAYHPAPWSFGPDDMSVGWFAWFAAIDRETCEQARSVAWNSWSATPGLKTKCLQDNVEPSPMARVIQ